jgi:uncharacterized protein
MEQQVAEPLATNAWRRTAQRRPVTLFLALALPISLALMSLPLMVEFGIVPGRSLPGRVGLDMEEVASVLLILSIFPVALLVTALEGGRPAVKALLQRCTRWRVSPRWWLLAVFALPTSTIGLGVASGDRARLPSAGTLVGELVALLVALLCINMWEEGTWAGFVQTHLERRRNFFVAAALTAVPFAAVHMPLRVITGDAGTVGELMTSFTVLVVFMVFIRSLLGTVVRGAANSVLLAAVTHTFFNRSNNVDGIAADVLTGDGRQNAALLATVVVTVVVAVLSRRQLSRSYRRVLDACEERPAATFGKGLSRAA